MVIWILSNRLFREISFLLLCVHIANAHTQKYFNDRYSLVFFKISIPILFNWCPNDKITDINKWFIEFMSHCNCRYGSEISWKWFIFVSSVSFFCFVRNSLIIQPTKEHSKPNGTGASGYCFNNESNRISGCWNWSWSSFILLQSVVSFVRFVQFIGITVLQLPLIVVLFGLYHWYRFWIAVLMNLHKIWSLLFTGKPYSWML